MAFHSCLSLSLPDVDFYHKRSKGLTTVCNANAKRESVSVPIPNSVVNPKKKSRDRDSTCLGSGLSMAHNTLAAPLSAVTHSDRGQVDRTSNNTPVCSSNSPKLEGKKDKSPLQQRFSVDSGIGSSGQDTAPVVPCSVSAVYSTPQPTKLNSSQGEQLKNGRGEGSYDSLSEPAGCDLSRNVLTVGGEPVTRYISPASQPPPPRSVHCDMYNTVFALQSLGDEGWSDYLTRVRTLWDGHMNKRLSVSNASGVLEAPAKPGMKQTIHLLEFGTFCPHRYCVRISCSRSLARVFFILSLCSSFPSIFGFSSALA